MTDTLTPSLPFALTAAKAAAHLGITEAALAQMRWRRDGPDYVKHGRAVRYLPSAIEAWWETNTVNVHPVLKAGQR
ncbi:helix-turn-helix domain-containing protein [Microbacterium sp. A84]|uniref:helix-turn-helix domain-containing protein n=1 Tax=Microbacterium sp. A84 TaxID=3450715 RepID=UPI003F432A0E